MIKFPHRKAAKNYCFFRIHSGVNRWFYTPSKSERKTMRAPESPDSNPSTRRHQQLPCHTSRDTTSHGICLPVAVPFFATSKQHHSARPMEVHKYFALHVVRTVARVAPQAPLRHITSSDVLERVCQILRHSILCSQGQSEDAVVSAAMVILRDLSPSCETLTDFETGTHSR